MAKTKILKTQKPSNIFQKGILLLLSITYLFFTFQNWNFISVGEIKWANMRNENIQLIHGYDEISPRTVKPTAARCEAYGEAYLNGEFKATFNNPNPNTSLCFLHLPAYFAKDYVSLNSYILILRSSVIFHNLLMLLSIFYFSSKIFSRRTALFMTVLLGLQPFFIGYSRVFNHDAIQGLYAINFILALWASLKKKSKKYLASSACFFALAMLTQFKVIFIIPFLFFFPIFYWYIENEQRAFKFFTKNLIFFYVIAISLSLVIMPAVVFFPEFLIQRFFLYSRSSIAIPTLLILMLFVTVFKNPSIAKKIIFPKLKTVSKVLVRPVPIIVIALFFIALTKQTEILEESFYEKFLSNKTEALWSSTLTLFYALTPSILILLGIWIINTALKPKLDYSLLFTLMFFILFILLTFSTFSSNDPDEGIGYRLVGTKYLFTLLPLLIIGLVSQPQVQNFLNKAKETFYRSIIALLSLSLILANLNFAPFYHNYNNLFLKEGYINTTNAWATDTSLLADYINSNLSDVSIYHPKGTLHPLVKPGISILPWHKTFWDKNPDYIIVNWDKHHDFAKILDYYRENKKPIWSIKKNGAVYSGIYKFDPTINHKKILLENSS